MVQAGLGGLQATPMKHTCPLRENGLFWSIHIKLHSGCLEEIAQL